MTFIHHLEDLNDLYQNAPCGYLSMRGNGNIINVNDTLLKYLDFKREEFLGKKNFQDLLNIGGKIYFETHLMPLLQIQGEVSEINLDLKGNGLIQVPSLLSAKRVEGINEEPIYRISVLIYTQRKGYERELINARKQVEKSYESIKRINLELERFANIASHDLRAPLRTISGMSSLIEKHNLIVPNSKGQQYFSLLLRNVKRMGVMIDDLLEYSKADVNPAKFEQVSLNEVCNQVLEMLESDIQKNKAILNIPKLPTVFGIKTQLISLIQNLFSNAIKYRAEADPIITVSFTSSPDFHTIWVKDNGMGFHQENAEKIFEFMQRLHSHDSIEGSGIGLSSCKRIIEKHSGEIGVESSPGKGSSFYFKLPLLSEECWPERFPTTVQE